MRVETLIGYHAYMPRRACRATMAATRITYDWRAWCWCRAMRAATTLTRCTAFAREIYAMEHHRFIEDCLAMTKSLLRLIGWAASLYRLHMTMPSSGDAECKSEVPICLFFKYFMSCTASRAARARRLQSILISLRRWGAPRFTSRPSEYLPRPEKCLTFLILRAVLTSRYMLFYRVSLSARYYRHRSLLHGRHYHSNTSMTNELSKQLLLFVLSSEARRHQI